MLPFCGTHWRCCSVGKRASHTQHSWNLSICCINRCFSMLLVFPPFTWNDHFTDITIGTLVTLKPHFGPSLPPLCESFSLFRDVSSCLDEGWASTPSPASAPVFGRGEAGRWMGLSRSCQFRLEIHFLCWTEVAIFKSFLQNSLRIQFQKSAFLITRVIIPLTKQAFYKLEWTVDPKKICFRTTSH